MSAFCPYANGGLGRADVYQQFLMAEAHGFAIVEPDDACGWARLASPGDRAIVRGRMSDTKKDALRRMAGVDLRREVLDGKSVWIVEKKGAAS